MIELNLLPPERKQKIRKKANINIPVAPVCVTLAAGLILIHILVLLLQMNSRGLAGELAIKWEQMKIQKDRTDLLAKESAGLRNKLDAIKRISETDIDWTRLLSGLNNAIIPNVWLVNFQPSMGKSSANKDRPVALKLSGYALGSSESATSTVGRFIKSLEAENNFMYYFSEIELVGVKGRVVSGEQAMSFDLICEVKEKGPEEKPLKRKNK